MTVGELGTMAVITEADGAGIGVWQPAAFTRFGVFGEPGTPSWLELHVRDYQAAVSFYGEVSGWDTHVVSDTPQFRYTTMRDPESDACAGRGSRRLGRAGRRGHALRPAGHRRGPDRARFRLVAAHDAMPARASAS
jgi:predicted enzyme related to lactoylglutathione lyase